MSEQQAPRTTSTIQAENSQLTYKAGQLQYIARQTAKDLDMINDRLRDLALEYVQVKAKEDEVKKLVEEAKAKDVADQKAKEDADKAQAEAGRAILQAVPQNPKGVDQATTQPGSGGTEPTPAGPVGQS